MCILDIFFPLVLKKTSYGSKKRKILKLSTVWCLPTQKVIICCSQFDVYSDISDH